MAEEKSKRSSLILQIIFVVVLVLVFSWFDPFDLLAPTKRTLKNTPIQIHSIREIGQLITAEYYGEVIASLAEVVGEQQYNEIQQFNIIVDDLHEEFTLTITDFIDEELPRNKDSIFEAFKSFNPGLFDNQSFNAYLFYINRKIKDRNYKRSNTDDILRIDEQKLLLKRLYLNRYDWRNKLFDLKTNEFKKTRTEVVERTSTKEYRNKRLVLIGRGWVKAGFDFGEFTEQNFRYDKTRKRIYFIGLKPQVLSATINPWFIPEEGVEGFEFLIAERGARLKPEYTKMVKQRCLDKLQKQAMDKNILLRSQENAETNLKAFFSLLLDEEIKGLHFYADYLDYTLDLLLDDSVIRNEEVYTIDSVINYYFNSYEAENKPERISDFIDSLKQARNEFYGKRYTLNSKSSLLFDLIKDRMIDAQEVAHLEGGLELNMKDSLWCDIRMTIEEDQKTREATAEDSADSDAKELLKKDIETFRSDLENMINEHVVDVDSIVLERDSFSIVISLGTFNVSLH